MRKTKVILGGNTLIVSLDVLFCMSLLGSDRTPPTGPFANLEPRDQEIGEFHESQKRRVTDFEARKL